MDELMFYDDELDDEGMVLIEEKPKKRRKRKNPEPTTIAMPLLLIAGYLGWCAYNQSKYKVWDWTPWRLAGKPSLKLLRQPRQTEEERQRARQAAYDMAVEKMMAASPSVVEEDKWRPRFFNGSEKETVSFIRP